MPLMPGGLMNLQNQELELQNLGFWGTLMKDGSASFGKKGGHGKKGGKKNNGNKGHYPVNKYHILLI